MRSTNAVWTAALALSGLALLSFLTRTFIDYRFVYPTVIPETRALGFVTGFNLVFYGGCAFRRSGPPIPGEADHRFQRKWTGCSGA
jgi:hypothetical protein